MRIVFLISSVLWLVFIYVTYDYGTLERLGGSMGRYIEAEEMATYSMISWGVGFISILFTIIGWIRVKRRGVKLISILSLIIALFVCFWVAIMVSSSGVDLDEIYLGLIGLGAVELLFSLIMALLAKKKK
ncbi:hypothetical protein K6119_07925 [Paracrocinitomix mangrovi]|uniref:hypothetical protein n=1 Tax=Paracrocinitomix mangrovi TaxID=2862509 RepID=UPI001C8F082C|nr:hypothetical protein [Paracrocinitomix mangrovi]UKN03439.1 hypothetical protein K6119_07925 [Paracrocinitomix mangrovi]